MAFSNEVFVALVVVAIASFVLIYYYAEARKRQRQPPGPWPWPIVGNFPALSDLPHRSLATLAAKYGGLMYLRLGSKPLIVISTVKVAREFYLTNDANFGARMQRLAWTVWHNGDTHYKTIGLTSEVNYWRRLRRLFNAEIFSPARRMAQQSTRAAELKHMMKLLVEDSKTGDAVNIKEWLYGVNSNTMTRILTGKRFFRTSDAAMEIERENLIKLNTTLFQMFGTAVISDFVPYLSFVTRLQGHVAKFEKVNAFADELMERCFDLDKHRQQFEERKNDPSYVPDVEDVLLHTPLDDGQYLPDKDVLKMLQELHIAGTETSATLVEWAVAELLTRPDLIKRAQAELDSAIHSHRLVEEADLPNLPFLQALIKETFRLHPPVPLLFWHVANQATEFQGYHFPAGTIAYVNTWAIHRDPSVYSDPDKFEPERFLERPEVNHMSASEYFELIPFGAGRRMCPAFNLGNTMGLLMLANLLYVFDWSLPEGERTVDMSEQVGLTCGLKTPLHLNMKPRFELDAGSLLSTFQ